MEALVILIAELIFAPAVAFAAALLEIIATVFSVLLEFFVVIAGRSRTKLKQQKDVELGEVQSVVANNKVLRRFRNSLLILAVVLICSAVLINYVFLDAVAKWTLARIAQRSGIVITYTSFKGDLFRANFVFTGLHAQRENDPYLDFDITAHSVDIDMIAFSNPFSHAELNHVKVAGVSGSLHRVQARNAYRERKPFSIKKLELRNVHLDYKDDTDRQKPTTLDIVIHDLASQPMRSHYALFDMFFRSNAHGMLNGKNFTIETGGNDAGRNTNWSIIGVPVELVRHQLGGPFNLLKYGTVDINVVDHWAIARSPDIHFVWTFTFKDLKAKVPSRYGGFKHKLAEHVVTYLNTRPSQFDISFGMTMNKEEFTGKSSLAAAGLWKTVVNTLVKQLSRTSGYREAEIKGTMKKGIDALKRFLDKKRKLE